MKTIFKYNLVTMLSEILMPQGAEIIDVQHQGNGPAVWAIVDTDEPPVLRTIIIVGTGQPLTAFEPVHLGTVQLPSGEAAHVFEVTSTKAE